MIVIKVGKKKDGLLYLVQDKERYAKQAEITDISGDIYLQHEHYKQVL